MAKYRCEMCGHLTQGEEGRFPSRCGWCGSKMLSLGKWKNTKVAGRSFVKHSRGKSQETPKLRKQEKPKIQVVQTRKKSILEKIKSWLR